MRRFALPEVNPMSGFCGIFSSAAGSAPVDLSATIKPLCRGHAAASGTHHYPSLRVHLGWVIDAPPLGDTFVASNEEQSAALVIKGDQFTTGTANASAVLRMYEVIGHRCFARLNGWFCGVVVDARKGTATVFNDRYGLGRVYYHESSRQGLCFATEAKAILAACPEQRELDERGVAEYVALGCVLQNRTLFRDVHLLPPASAWTFDRNGHLEKTRYFDPAEWEQQTALTPAQFRIRLSDIFARAVRGAMTSSFPIGMSLTGGLDSRAVIAWAQAAPGALPCYTFGGPYRDCADVRIARELAEHCHQPHTTIRMQNDFFPQFETLAEKTVFLTDGTMDVSGAVELYVNRFAGEIAPVRLTGNYGSEIIRGNVALRPSMVDRRWYTPEFSHRLDEATATYTAERVCHPVTFIAFKQVPWHHFARFAAERAAVIPRSPFLHNDLVALSYQAPLALRERAQTMFELIGAGAPQLATMSTDRGTRSDRATLLGAVTEAWQHATVRAEYAYDYGMPSWLARADHMLMPLHVERLFLGRHKFYHFRVWYRDQLRDYVRARIESIPEERFGYRPGAIRRIIGEHTTGRGNHTLALHKALTLQVVDKLLLHST